MKRTRFFRSAAFFLCALFLMPSAALPTTAARQSAPPFPSHAVPPAPSTSAQGAYLLEPLTGTVLYEKNADERLPMASTTKIMTALVALENLAPETVFTVPAEACGTEGSGIGLKPGEEIRIGDLLSALMLESANDAAEALAFALAGGIGAFADRMNEKAEELGLDSTHYVNPHGLDDEEHYTTARDLAVLSAAALENDAFRSLVSTVRQTIPGPGGGTRWLLNHNRLLREREDVIGVKTGFTKRSGRCLVSAAERDGVRLIAVTLNDPDDWADHRALFDYGFSRCRGVTAAEPGSVRTEIPCPGMPDGVIHAENAEGFRTVFLDEAPELRCMIEAPRLLFAPLEAGQRIGTVIFYAGEQKLCALPLILTESTPPPREKPSLFQKIFRN